MYLDIYFIILYNFIRMSRTNIYILLFEGKSYYMEKSNNINSRYQEIQT